jgi:hypothetical protein
MNKIKTIIFIISTIILLLVIFINIPENRREIKTPHFTFLFSRSIDSLNIVDISKVLEGNYSKISENLKTKPAPNIEVNIYDQRWRYVKATGHWNASGNIEGISKLHFVDNTWLESEIGKIAVHEFTHAVVLKSLLDLEIQPVDSKSFDNKFSTFPIWLWEAICVYEAGQFYDPNMLEYFKDGNYPEIAELNIRSRGQKIYTCGYTIIEYILNRYGQDQLIQLIQSYGDIMEVFNISEEQFSNEWYKFMSEKYLKGLLNEPPQLE